MKKRKSIKKNYIYNLIYTIFNTVLPLLTAPYLARAVGATGIGIYAYYYAIAHIFCVAAKLGLTNYGTRQISKSSEKDLSKTFSSIFYQQMITAFIANIIYFGYCFLFVKSGSDQMYGLIMGLNILGTFFDIDWLFSGLESFKQIALKNIFVKVMTVILIFVFVKNTNDLWIYILLMSLGTLLGHLSMWTNLKKYVSFVKVDFKDVIKHIKPNLILVIPVFAISIYRSMDKVMLGSMSVSMMEIGYYENAEKIIYTLCGFISAFGTVMMPRISNLIENKKIEEAKKYLNVSMKFMMFMMFAMSFGILATSSLLSVVLFGKSFYPSGSLMGLLALTLPMISWANVIRTQYIIPNSKDKIYIKTVVIGALLNMIVNFICIPFFGAMGAVLGTIVAELSIPVTQYIILKKEINYEPIIRNSIPPLIIATIMYYFVISLSYIGLKGINQLLLQIICGGLFYLVIVFLYVYYFDKELFNYIKRMIKK